jgi:ATP-dependent Clp protease ATP-binding subunit ClpA
VDEIDGLRVGPRFRRPLAAALQEARRRGHTFLGSEHVLLGILSEPDCVAARILADLGVADATGQRLRSVIELREELLRRRELDQAPMRQMHGKPVDPDLVERLNATIHSNTEWLRAVIDEWGWPGRSLVGEDGANAAWLIAQHSDHDPAFQRTCLDHLTAAARGDASQSNLAYLTDRVLEGARQAGLRHAIHRTGRTALGRSRYKIRMV